MGNKPVKVTPKLIKTLLETPFWPGDITTNATYFRTHDDCDGERREGLAVYFAEDGDAYIKITVPALKSCRFRTVLGGGNSQRVRNALLLLAVAIKLDNEENKKLEAEYERDIPENFGDL